MPLDYQRFLQDRNTALLAQLQWGQHTDFMPHQLRITSRGDGIPSAPNCPYTQQLRSSQSRLRAPALGGCAKPHSHNTVFHTEKDEPAPPVQSATLQLTTGLAFGHPQQYYFFFVRVALGQRSPFPDLSGSQLTWVRALLPCLPQCTHSACKCASFPASHTLSAEEESWTWHLLCRSRRCALKGNCFQAIGTTLSGLH